MANIVFIGGTGRCGTHITKDILTLHSRVCSLPFEYRFIIDPDGLVDFYCGAIDPWSPYMISKRLERLKKLFDDLSARDSSRYNDWGLERHIPGWNSLVDGLMEQLTDFSYDATWCGGTKNDERMSFAAPKTYDALAGIIGGFIQTIADGIVRKAGAAIFVEDNTWNILFANELATFVPDAKFIHVYRDPRDVVDSMANQAWCPDSRLQCAQMYVAIMREWSEIKSRLPQEQIFEFSIDHLVANRHEVTGKICDFIGIDCEMQMAEIDLNAGHLGRWVAGYSKEDKKSVLPLLEPYIQLLGYK